jgi:hypothetical protein
VSGGGGQLRRRLRAIVELNAMNKEEQFERVWEHLRRNRHYKARYKQGRKDGEGAFDGPNPVEWPVNPKLDWKKALAILKTKWVRFDESPLWKSTVQRVRKVVQNPPVEWNIFPADDAPFSERLWREFIYLMVEMDKAEARGDGESAAAARQHLRKFFEVCPVVYFGVDSSVSWKMALAAFEHEWKRVQEFRRKVGLTQPLQRKQQKPRGDWREQLVIYDAVMKHAKFVDGKLVLDDNTLRRVMPKEYAKLPQQQPVTRGERNDLALLTRQIEEKKAAGKPREFYAVAMSRQRELKREVDASERAQTRFENAKTTLRRRVENAFEPCRARIEAVYSP